MDVNTIAVFLPQNSVAIKNLGKLMFEDCKSEIQELNEESELRTENKKLQKSFENSHNQTNYVKRRIDEPQSAFSAPHDADLSDRGMNLEHYTRKKKARISGIVEQADETCE